MKCERCENDATVHEVTVRNGTAIERHLCEICAAQFGIAGGVIPDLMKHGDPASGAAISISTVSKIGGRPTACPACGLSYSEFKQGGMLGCAECYRTFEGQLGPLLERAHEGGIAHTGKSPRRVASGTPAAPTQPDGLSLQQRAERLQALQRQLDQAVRNEQYEIAAKVRDEIRHISAHQPPPVPPSAS
jgi:protein arginine kinase activator